MTAPIGIGIIGAGVISDQYLQNLTAFPDVEVIVIGDQIIDRARAQAEKYSVPKWGTTEDVLSDADVQLVVNLTIPSVHVAVSSAAIAAGKHVWSEKPIGLNLTETAELLQSAERAGVRIGSAPDTLLGAGFQTARRAIAEGVIGTPLFAQTVFQTQGPDLWHPSPQFLFAKGAGPLLDTGPYYVSALVSLFGSVSRVSAFGSRARTERKIHTGPDAGKTFPVEVPTTVQMITSFESGQQAQSLLSFDSALERAGVFEVHGSEGSLVLSDPNLFTGRVAVVHPLGVITDADRGEQEWVEIERRGVVAGRGLGVLDMVRAMAESRPHVASGELAHHVLDVLLSAERSAATNQTVQVQSSVSAVPAVPVDFDPYTKAI